MIASKVRLSVFNKCEHFCRLHLARDCYCGSSYNNNNNNKNAYAGPHTAVAPSGHRRNPFSVILFLAVVVVVYKLCRTKHCSVRYNELL